MKSFRLKETVSELSELAECLAKIESPKESGRTRRTCYRKAAQMVERIRAKLDRSELHLLDLPSEVISTLRSVAIAVNNYWQFEFENFATFDSLESPAVLAKPPFELPYLASKLRTLWNDTGSLERGETTLQTVASEASRLKQRLRKLAKQHHDAKADWQWCKDQISLKTENAKVAENLLEVNQQAMLRAQHVLELNIAALESLSLEVMRVLPTVAKRLRLVSRNSQELTDFRFNRWDELESELAEIEVEAVNAIEPPSKIPGLAVNVQGNTVTWKTTTHHVSKEFAELFHELIEKHPEPINAGELFARKEFGDFRWPRLKKNQPRPLVALVKTSRGKGTRLVIPT